MNFIPEGRAPQLVLFYAMIPLDDVILLLVVPLLQLDLQNMGFY